MLIDKFLAKLESLKLDKNEAMDEDLQSVARVADLMATSLER